MSSDDRVTDPEAIRSSWEDDSERLVRRVYAALNSGRDAAVVQVVLDETDALRAEVERLNQTQVMLDALTERGALTEERPTDGGRPHRFPTAAIGEEVIAWTCQACGEVIREFGPYEPGECPIDWRDDGRRRLVTPWEVAP